MTGARVRVLDNFSTGARANLGFAPRFRRQLEVLRGDIRNLPAVLRAARGARVIYHQAAMRSVPRSVKDPLGANENNVSGTLNVLEAARRCRVPRVVYASSSSVYGDRPDLPKREDQPVAPLSPYAASKAAGEQYAAIWTRLYGVETVGLRYFNVFGPRQDPKSEYAAVIPRFILWGLRGRLLEIVARLEAILGRRLERKHTPVRSGDVPHTLADVSKAKRLLGYEPLVDFDEGFRRTVDYFTSSLKS